MFHRSRQALSRLQRLSLIGLMAFVLTGIQLVQVSPLHDHAKHSVECVLCHLHLGDDTIVHQAPVLDFVASSSPADTSVREFNLSHVTSPYQGRAPPPLFS